MYKNILVPVMLDQEHNPTASFQVARALASEGAEITVLHVMEAIPAFVANEIPDQVLADRKREAEDALAKAAAGLPGGKVALITGHAGRTILDYAEEYGVDCIIVASHKPGMQDFFLGSTAARVVRHARCAVHVIR